MGVNIISGCHKCKVKVFHWRGEENVNMIPFYYKHKLCAQEDINNVQSVMDNNGTDQDWCNDFKQGGYKDDSLQIKLTPPNKRKKQTP